MAPAVFQRLGTELLAEFLAVDLLGKDPFVEPVGIETRTESVGETVLPAALEDHLLGRKVGYELVDVGIGALGNVEFARRDVEKGDAGDLRTEENRSQVSILLVGKNVVAHDHARCNQLDDPALDQPLDGLGVLQLLADGYPLARPHQLGQVGVDGVVGKARQLDERRRTVGAAREGDAQNAARLDGVFAEGFVEVADTKQQHGIGMHRLDGIILLHQGCLDVFFFGFLFGSHNKIL